MSEKTKDYKTALRIYDYEPGTIMMGHINKGTYLLGEYLEKKDIDDIYRQMFSRNFSADLIIILIFMPCSSTLFA